jgi:hypothetical protein
VYFRENGSSKIYSVEQAKGRIGLTGSGGTRGNAAAEDHRHVPRCFRREAQEGTGTQESLPEGKVNRSTGKELVKLDVAIETFLRERGGGGRVEGRRCELDEISAGAEKRGLERRAPVCF